MDVLSGLLPKLECTEKETVMEDPQQQHDPFLPPNNPKSFPLDFLLLAEPKK